MRWFYAEVVAAAGYVFEQNNTNFTPVALPILLFNWNSRNFPILDSVSMSDYIESGGKMINPYPTAFPYGNGMVLHFYQQQESSTTKTVHKVINRGLKAYV